MFLVPSLDRFADVLGIFPWHAADVDGTFPWQTADILGTIPWHAADVLGTLHREDAQSTTKVISGR